MKYLKKLYAIFLVTITIFAFIAPVNAWYTSYTYKKTGVVYPEIIGLGAKDVISWTVDSGKILSVTVSQQGGSMLGIINTKPGGYYMKSANVLITTWKLTVSAPFKIFNLERGLYVKTIQYTLGLNGSMTMRIISSIKY